jgi:hypothetical protein
MRLKGAPKTRSSSSSLNPRLIGEIDSFIKQHYVESVF